jgi:acetolactate synthase-1/2/3 large subunit
MQVLSKYLNNEIVVTDMGTAYTCTMQALQMNGKVKLFTSSACCSMGFGLPGAIGSIVNGERPVICIAGDGGFQMNIQELQTIVHYNLPVKMFILNNNGYLAISLMQDNLFNKNYVGCNNKSGVSSPKFTKIADAYNIKSYTCNSLETLENVLPEILSSNSPVLCEIQMIENQLLIPRVQSRKDENGKIVSATLDNMFPFLINK